MRRPTVLVALLLGAVAAVLASGPLPAPAAVPAGFRVVVHADNPAVEAPAGTVSKMFLKRLSRWDDGVQVEPVDQSESSAVRKAFSDAVHHKSVSAIKSFWQRMIFSGRDVPPSELGSDAEVLDFVRDHRGAIGYVAAEGELGDDVKELKVTE